MPCIMNAANEIAVSLFLNKQIRFLAISELIEKCMGKITYIPHPTIDDYYLTDKETRAFAESIG